MRVLTKAQDSVSRFIGRATRKVGRLRHKRQRSHLLTALGKSCYDHHKGLTKTRDETDRILKQIESLDEVEVADAGNGPTIDLDASTAETKTAEQV